MNYLKQNMSGIVLFINIINYFKTPVSQSLLSQFLTKELIALLTGMFFIFQVDWFIATFPALTMVYDVVVLTAGLRKIQVAADMFGMKHKK